MRLLKSKISAVLAVSLAFSAGTLASSPMTAEAACKGDNKREFVSADPRSGAELWNVKVDSCKASELVDSYSKVKSSAGLASLLGAKWWPVGVTAGVFTAWAWANQETVKKCASSGTGISFKEASGIVVNCTPQ